MKSIPSNPFVLVDGSSYLFRAYHALPPLTNSVGQPTGAIYGVVNMLRKLMQRFHPTQMAVVFDSKEKNFRHEIFPEYKANRVVMPQELAAQIEPLHQVIEAMGLPLVVIPGVEADDIIGTLAKAAEKRGLFTLISTGDKDFAQLVNDHIYLINTMSDEIFDRERVIEKFAVPPEKIVDYLALIGDSVDNVPGVYKVGPKTALKWLETYGDLEGISQNANEVTGKVGENLREALDQLPLFRTLVTIKTDIQMDYTMKQLVLGEPNLAQLQKLFETLEFRSWLKEIKLPTPTRKTEYECILTESALKQWVKALEEAPVLAVDTETDRLEYMDAKVVGLSFATEPGKACYIPFGHTYEGCPPQLTEKQVWSALKPLLEDPKPFKVGHNLKFDMEVLANHDVQLQGVVFDTMLESYVLGSTANRHDLGTLSQKYLDHTAIAFEEVAGKGAKQISFKEVPLDKACEYAAEDADLTLRLHHYFWPKLEGEKKQRYVFEHLEVPLITVLAYMERTGVLIDPKTLAKQGKELEARIKACEDEIHALSKREFNINSPKQLQEVLYTDLKLPVLSKTPGGQPSTAEAVLQDLSQDFALPALILEYRSLVKLKSTYIDRLPEQINPRTGRVHTSYHQAVTSTGRLSSSDPNLQNIPVRTEEGRKIRSAFIASPGYKMVSADYSQIELRIMAHLSQDKRLVQAFEHGDDIHKSTAAMIHGIALDKVTPELRRSAKAINFGLMYGMSAFGLAKQIGVSREEAEAYIKLYFDCFPEVKVWMDKTRVDAAKHGFVETVFGRRLYLPDLNSSRVMERKAAERAAINAPMQGTNADLIKKTMIEIYDTIVSKEAGVRLIMQVHDELVFEIKDSLVETIVPKIQKIMENSIQLSVPLQVDVGIGLNWNETH